MKYLLIFFSLISFAYAQEPAYTPMRLNYQFRGIKVDSLFLIPSFNDTTAANSSTMKNVAGAMIRTGNDFWMRNATTNAWLQNVNTGDGASPSVEIITDISRKPLTDTIQVTKSLGLDETPQFAFRDRGFDTLRRRNDSVFAVRWAVEVFQFKDSGSAYAGDSPDRINGTATTKVISDMSSNDLEIINFNKTTLNGDTIQMTPTYLGIAAPLFNIRGGTGTGMDIAGQINQIEIKKSSFTTFNVAKFDSLGNVTLGLSNEKARIEVSQSDTTIAFYSSDPMTWEDKAYGLKSQVKTGYADNGINLTIGTYLIKVPGLYIVNTADNSNDLRFPDAAFWKGQSIQVVNTDGGVNIIITSQGSSVIYEKGTSNNMNIIDPNFMAIFYSDGQDWYGFKL